MEGSGAPLRKAPVLLAAVAVALMLLLSLAVAGGGGAHLGEPRLPVSLRGAAEGLGDLATMDGEAQAQPQPEAQGNDMPWALIVLGLLATVLVAAALRTLRAAQAEERRPGPDAEVAHEAVGGDVAQLTALRRAAAAGRRRVDGAEPGAARDAVVAAWLALEQAAAAGGRPRQAAETPTEFTVALLRRHAADEAATTTLLALYHRARFGSSPLPAEAPSAAAAALDAISTSLHRARA